MREITLIAAGVTGAAYVAYTVYRRCRAEPAPSVPVLFDTASPSSALPFHILDVFTDEAEASSGNQLLVVEDRADVLTSDAMQAIAAEIGFAESAFVCSAGAVRIFTIDEEVPQAGHPIIGLAEIVGGPSSVRGKHICLRTKKGPIDVKSGQPSSWFMSQDAPEWLGHASRLAVASILVQRDGHESKLVGSAFPIGSTCGLPYALVPVTTEAALDALAVDAGASPERLLAECTALPNGLAVYFYHRTGTQSCRTRMFCHEGGRWVEDVATGSAAGPLACHLAPISACFTQGSARRAKIQVNAAKREGARVEVGGSVRRVASGRWSVP